MYKCLCCGWYTLPVPPEEAVAFICPVCMWENDVFTANVDEPSDENHSLTLRQGRANYQEYGVCDVRLKQYAREPTEEEQMNYHKINHQGSKILETERLILRPFTLDDAGTMFRNWASDPEVTKFLTWPTHASREVSEKVLQDWVEQYEKPDCYQWAIVPRELGEPVGSIAVVGQDQRAGKATVGYCIGRGWWHQGITSGAMARVIDFLIGEVGFNRVESWHDPRNPNSGAVMAKCGMTYEATLRQADWNNQGICDLCMYAILAEDWHRRDMGRTEKQIIEQNGML